MTLKSKEELRETLAAKQKQAEQVAQESANALTVASVKENYVVEKTSEGKFVRKAVYTAWASVVPETREQKIALMNLLNSGEEGNGLRDFVGAQIVISDVIFNPYDRINEETGEQEYGVLTYIITPDGTPYVTSSKSVYFTLKRAFQVFGEPHYTEGEELKVQVIRKKGREFEYIDLKIIG